MKTSLIRIFAISSFPIVLAFLSACATSGFEQAAQTKDSVQKLNKTAQSLSAQIDITNNALQTLLDIKAGDPKAQYDTFSKALDKTHSLTKDLQNNIDSIKSYSDATVAQRRKVEETIVSAELREVSKKRTDDFQKKYDEINTQAVSAAGSVQTYLSEMTDISKLLSTDLSISGINNASSFGKKAISASNAVKKTLGELSMNAIKVAEETSYTVIETPKQK